MITKLHLVVLAAMLLAFSTSAHAQSNFFQGKTVRVIRGGQAGDLYDLWTRHIATYLGKHIPGNPSVM
ncbi:MAG: Bug family tripartite tricarboxylate transporter substrate binding protein, partial [Candidatus Binatia bacterium]